MTVIRRYTFKLYPKPAQEAALRQTAVMCARLWNAMLARIERRYWQDDEATLAEIMVWQEQRRGQHDAHMREWGRSTAFFAWQKTKAAQNKIDKKKHLTAFDLCKEITQLRSACPEHAAVPSSIQQRIASDLDRAFQAFFRRVREGAEEPGYPRYKNVREATAIPFKGVGNAWSMRTTNSARADTGGCDTRSIVFGRKTKQPHKLRDLAESPGGIPENVGMTQGKRRRDRHLDPGGIPENVGMMQADPFATSANLIGGIPENAGLMQDSVCRRAGRKTVSSWRLNALCCPGEIRVRGQFPKTPLALKTADIKYHGGTWWFSVAAEIDRQRAGGNNAMKIRFDLLDEFAQVECAKGAHGLPSHFSNAEMTNTRVFRGTLGKSGHDTPETEGNRGCLTLWDRPHKGHDTPETEGNRGRVSARRGCGHGHDIPETEGNRGQSATLGLKRFGHDTPETEGNRGECGEIERLRNGHDTPETEDKRGRASPEGDTKINPIDALKSNRDKRYKRGSIRWRREKARAARLSAREARQRSEALHLWSSRIIAQASALEVTTPVIKKETASGRGTAQKWGAAVRIKAELNRHILSMAPASAVQMLAYKAEEAGIEFVLVKDEAPVIAVGNDLVETTKVARRARRKLKEAA